MGLAAPSGSSQSTASGISSLHFTSPHLTWGGCHPYLEGWYTLLWGIPPPNTNITLHFRVKSLRWERSASAAQLRKKHVSVFSPQSWGCNPLSGDMLRSLCSCFAFYAFPPSITSFFSSSNALCASRLETLTLWVSSGTQRNMHMATATPKVYFNSHYLMTRRKRFLTV